MNKCISAKIVGAFNFNWVGGLVKPRGSVLAGKRKAKVKAIYLIKINFAEQVFRGSEFRRVHVCNILAVVLSSLAARKHGYGQLIGEAERGEGGREKKR